MGYLRQLVRAFGGVYVVLGVLDGGLRDKYRKDILQALVDLRAWSEPSLYLLVTSRKEPDIRDVLLYKLGTLQYEAISMKNNSVEVDIASFISSSLRVTVACENGKDITAKLKKRLQSAPRAYRFSISY